MTPDIVKRLTISFVVLLLTGDEALSLGQSRWCFVPKDSETLFCDYKSFGGCLDANPVGIKDGGICVPNPAK